MKKLIALLSLAVLSAASISASAADDSSQSFRYTVSGNSVYLSGDVQTSENADVFWGFYDNGVLIKLDKHGSGETFDNIKVDLPYIPENLEVKSFLWTSDNKMTPLTVRADAEKQNEQTSLITPETNISIVMSEPETIEIDGRNYVALTVAKDGQENVQINVEPGMGAENVSDGDIVIYHTRYDGTTTYFNVVFEADTDYYSFLDKSISGFSSMIKTIDENNVWKWSSDDTECKAYFGPVYHYSNKSLELFTEQENGISDLRKNIDYFVLFDSNTYIYDYSMPAKHSRVIAGALPFISKSIYSSGVFVDDEKNQLSWDLVKEYECNPCFAFVKTTDGEVTDVVMFLAP